MCRLMGLYKKVMEQPPKPPFSKTVKSSGGHKKAPAFSYHNKTFFKDIKDSDVRKIFY